MNIMTNLGELILTINNGRVQATSDVQYSEMRDLISRINRVENNLEDVYEIVENMHGVMLWESEGTHG